MDADRFDAFSQAFSDSPTRRGALRALSGLIVGGALGRLGQADAEAKRGANKPCPPCRKKKHGKCNKAKKPDGTPCGPGKICLSGKCRQDPSL